MDHKAPAGGPLVGGWELAFPNYTPAQLFALASDIESYPFFVPGCVATRIIERNDNLWRVDNVFALGPVRHRFISHAELNAPDGLEITSTDGPWKSFRLSWQFAPLEQGCQLLCRFSAEFRSSMVATIAALGHHGVERRIMAAFERRAKALYG
ncbi:MAG TPA: type II toxin-antitoxin system RatA family toxin [Telmatospirillum sp.]|nr:type II toxin-antitoxin system RatA family toxin [Telmatospirillum sp.]